MRRTLAILLALASVAGAACRKPPQQAPGTTAALPLADTVPRPNDTRPWQLENPPTLVVAADSITLERTACYGFCPVYRLRITKDGAVRFTSRDPRDQPRSDSARIDAARFQELLREADRIGFSELPAEIEGSKLCRMMATDLPSAIVTIYRPDGIKRVDHYHGCHTDELLPLREFEARIDSVAGSSRWIRPANRRG